MASAADMSVVHGMQEVSGSSPLSSTQVKHIIRIKTGERAPGEGHSEGQDPQDDGRLASGNASIVISPG
jgi:hypothetical protein